MKIAVSMPHRGCVPYLRRAVDSILNQTHRDLVLIVAHDGGDAPWDVLRDCTDPRLVRWDAGCERGPYFLHEAVRRACETSCPYLLIQDADDWSEPHRVERLLAVVTQPGVVTATSALWEHTDDRGPGSIAAWSPPQPQLNAKLTHRHWHVGLHAMPALAVIGGYYLGERLGTDTLLMSLLMMIGEVVRVEDPLYHRRIRAGSLTTSYETGMGSPERHRVRRKLDGYYTRIWPQYEAYARRKISRGALLEAIQATLRPGVSALQRSELDTATAQLTSLIHARP